MSTLSRWDRDVRALSARLDACRIVLGRVVTFGHKIREQRLTVNAAGDETLRWVTYVRVPAADFTVAPTRHTVLTVDGETHTLRDVRRVDDGRQYECWLVVEEA